VCGYKGEWMVNVLYPFSRFLVFLFSVFCLHVGWVCLCQPDGVPQNVKHLNQKLTFTFQYFFQLSKKWKSSQWRMNECCFWIFKFVTFSFKMLSILALEQDLEFNKKILPTHLECRQLPMTLGTTLSRHLNS
jgi:hypothetical protein